MMKKLWIVLTATLLTLTVSGLTGCEEEDPATPDALLEKAAEHPKEKTPEATPKTQAPKDHPAH